MLVSFLLFDAYIECPTKCWLRSHAEPIVGNSYADWARVRNEVYCAEGIKRLLATVPESDHAIAPLLARNAKDTTWRLAIDMSLVANASKSRLEAVERLPAEGRGRPAQFIPYRFEFANKLSKNDKRRIGFDALLLSEAIGREVSLGKIMHGDGHATHKVKLSSLASEVKKRIKDVTSLLDNNLPPDLVLNRHCSQCEFQARCHKQAMEKDELSLLSRMSGKERKKLHGKGIFTITQLSYTFRPRRRRRKMRGKQEKFHHSLRALAIRENKIHAIDLLDPKLNGTPVYLDVEGLPDRDFYYLIGIRVGTGDAAAQYSFWADDEDSENRIWNQFLDVLSTIPDPQLVHYGSYETAFLKRMQSRYGCARNGSVAATAIGCAINLLTFVFARIYFPTLSNALKEIAAYLGFRWPGSPASGLEAIIWRHRWEASRDPADKQALLDYNLADCEALELVANKLVELHHRVPAEGQLSRNDVVCAADIKRERPFEFKLNKFVFPEMETINKAAYWDYQRERVYVKSGRRPTRKRGRHAIPRSALTPNTTLEYQRPSFCPTCKSKEFYGHGKRTRTVVDLRFLRHGLKRWITRHVARRYRCQSCRSTFYPPERRWTGKRYGPNLTAYAMYLNIELRLPQDRVSSSINKLFGLRLPRGSTNGFKAAAAEAYRGIYSDIIKRLCSGHLLHVDETGISVKGNDGYVWVLTSMEEVAYLYTPTREGSTIQAMLENFSGVLVSDFYAAYDTIECPQQKCVIHFIRDLNDELLKHPYDQGLKQLVGAFAGLVKPMVETVDRHGLKRRFLGKHRAFVDRFYKRLAGEFGIGEPVKKITERLQKNGKKMFTFLDFDGIPWNNNNAEHAVKAFASLRRVIDGPTTENGLRDFLVLLSFCETCKYKNVEFLDFLRSGSRDIDKFSTNSL